MLASRRVAQLAQRFGFDLTNPFTGNVELFTNLLEGVVGIHVDTVTHALPGHGALPGADGDLVEQ